MTAETMPVGEMPAREGDFTVEGHGMEPIPENARYGSVSRVFTVWFTPNLVPAAFFIGTLVTLSFLQLGFWTSILAIIVGNVVGALFVALLSTMGPKLGLAQMPAARLPFGKSIALPGLLNWLSTIGWDGINNVFGAIALTILIPGFPFWAALLVIVVCQAALGIIGYEAIHTFEKWMAFVPGRHVRGADHLDLRPGPGRHQRRRWHERRGPGRCLRRLRRHRRQLRPGLVPLRLGLLPLPALQHEHRPRVLVHAAGAVPVRRLARGPGRAGGDRRRPAASRATRSTPSSVDPGPSSPRWPWSPSSSGRSRSTR